MPNLDAVIAAFPDLRHTDDAAYVEVTSPCPTLTSAPDSTAKTPSASSAR